MSIIYFTRDMKIEPIQTSIFEKTRRFNEDFKFNLVFNYFN